MNYYIYDESGEIVKWGIAPLDEITLQANDGQTACEGLAHPATHYVENGVLTAYSELQVAAKNSRPLYPCAWDNKQFCWLDLRDIERKKADELEAFNEQRRSAYPPIEDLADALYWQANGDDSKMTAYLEKCRQVKENIPKF